MAGNIQRIAVLTSGGDAPGMNAALRAVVRKGIYHDLNVFGINRGYEGLIHGEIQEMTIGSVADIVLRGGTILKTARSEEMRTVEGQQKAFEQLHKLQIDALVVIGGDGSFRGAQTLAAKGFQVVGIPGTIDNDIAGTDLTIGFDTAINTVVDAVSKIRDTASSHERTFIVEVMGRDCGNIALQAGIACGAESILVPEIPYDLDEISEKLKRGHQRGKNHSIILVSEGVGSAYKIGEELRERSGFETRITVLGHLQRGGNPSALDAVIAAAMGGKAIEIIMAGESNRMTAYVNQRVVSSPIDAAYGTRSPFNRELYDLANELSI
ncbi:6-phosphofructokinase [Desulfosporosinus sp. BICA1-9]|uniref:6-phosphofructokinase n=1 Tax=Desulfosporosinus sp. BICA1-9 TaxID=1531958 RepID=UPI00054B0356|nr:6-phosphofructokinase [Desulfosporosinus sp. BICA1-9]KJS49339.1 MAG: 6-phosphofructokinase [Peptococcaceae bacterium BRH_c23]KJS80706.1 MAG: 6-phosphofructokinase [Desulfosporosinus sp. BICA1-9]HBW35657.1 6-phosphofructokinase [Desulfosporosinus sp.]